MTSLVVGQFASLEIVLGREPFKKKAASIRVLLLLLIKTEEDASKVKARILHPIMLFLEGAPGLQKTKRGKIPLTDLEIARHMKDVEFRTTLLPCIGKVLRALQYTEGVLYQLSREDFAHCCAMILAVREQLHITIPPATQVKRVKDEVALGGLKDQRSHR